mmetsp:Transcript_23577/g.51591  ORF Transcript_23577/g.51591 Transcript_23577/m.51591 type:complete len:470 (-) Transcript_23577:147-1556(-)
MKSPKSAVALNALAFTALLLLQPPRVVESFSSARHRHGSRTSSLSLPLSSSLPSSPLPSFLRYGSNHQQRFRHQLQAAPETKSSAASNTTNANANANANTNATTVAELSSASTARVKRAWTLDSSTGIDKNANANADASTGAASLTSTTTAIDAGGISDYFRGMDMPQKLQVLGKISWFPGRVQEAQLVVGLVMAFSAFAQALTGFGFAVVAVGAMSTMPWLLHSELFNVITPVAATLGAMVGFILLIPFAVAGSDGDNVNEDNPGLEWDQILPLLIPCTVLTPVGMQLNNMVDPLLATRVLAALIMGFVVYKLVPTVTDALHKHNGDATGAVVASTADDADDAAPSPLQSRTAAILLGSAAGIFGGAFDVQGPPLCVFGDAAGWSPARFRNNVLAVVCLNSALVVAIDAVQGTLGDFYYCYFCLTSLPGVLLGVVAGQYASSRIDPGLFKNLVLVMCLGLGLQLLTVS